MAQQYVEAGNLLDHMMASDDNKFSLRKHLYEKVNKKFLIANILLLVSETIKYELIEKSYLIQLNKPLRGRGHIIQVMLYDLLFGKKEIIGSGLVKKAIMSQVSRIESELVKLKVSRHVSSDRELIPAFFASTAILPRWVRVNFLRCNVNIVSKSFRDQGWLEVPIETFFKNLEDYQEQLAKREQEAKPIFPKHYSIDPHVPGLLAFPPMLDLHDNWALASGSIVLQDKASALSALALNAPPGSIVLDACAAPGQKTAQIAQSMGNTGSLYATDIEPSRLITLRKLSRRNGLKNLIIQQANFLEIKPNQAPWNNVEYLLLDPSCSGSGVISNINFVVEAFNNESDTIVEPASKYLHVGLTPSNQNDYSSMTLKKQKVLMKSSRKAAITKFRKMQSAMLWAAFQFPKVKRIVYSTCSVHDEENEQVVEAALEKNTTFELVNALPQLENMRGKSQYSHGKFCVRTVPERDHTIGFFLAVFQRKNCGDMDTEDKFRPQVDFNETVTFNKRDGERSSLKEKKRPIGDINMDSHSDVTIHQVSTPISSKSSLYQCPSSGEKRTKDGEGQVAATCLKSGDRSQATEIEVSALQSHKQIEGSEFDIGEMNIKKSSRKDVSDLTERSGRRKIRSKSHHKPLTYK